VGFKQKIVPGKYIAGHDPGSRKGATVVFLRETQEILELIPNPTLDYPKQKSRKVRKTDKEYGQINPKTGKAFKTKSYTADIVELDLFGMDAMVKGLKAKYGDELYVYVEKVNARPDEGATGSFTFGGSFTSIRQALIAYGIKFEELPPCNWTKPMHKGTSTGMKAKDRSMAAAAQKFPPFKERFVLPGKRTPHGGLVDGALIGLYGCLAYGKV